MATNDKSTKHDEYTLNDRDDLLGSAGDGATKTSASPKLPPRIRKIVVISVVIGIVITAYNLFTPSKKIQSVKKKSAKKNTSLVASPPVPVPTKVTVQQTHPVVLKTKMPEKIAMVKQAMPLNTNLRSQDISEIKEMISNNSKQLQNLMLHLGAADKVIIGLNKTIQGLQLRVRRLNRDIVRLKYHKSLVDLKKSIKPEDRYHIRAIVPGRAWLVSDRGNEVSVRMGSKLGPYGKVTAIDWQKGLVRTSSHLNIDYGSNDI